MKRKRVLVMITPISYLRIGGVSRFAKDHDWVLTIHDRLGGIPPSTDYDGVLVTLRGGENTLKYVKRMTARGIPVPDDIAILSIGDDPLVTDNQPVPISCIRQNLSRGGYTAAALLDRLMNGGRRPADPILVKPEGITVRRSTDTVADDNPLIRKVLLYIRDNLHRPFGAEQVADALGESRSRLDKTCAARFGQSLGKTILAHRLAEAKRLLRKGELNIKEIAARTGFCAPNYLIKKFKAAFGTTPLRWRRDGLQSL